MPLGANAIQSIRMLTRGGKYFVPADSGMGSLYRPTVKSQMGGRAATMETLFDFFIDAAYNPDEAKQIDPLIEDKIRFHPDVMADWEKRCYSVASMPWHVSLNNKAEDKKLAEKIAMYCQSIIAGLPKIEQMFEMMQWAIIPGGQGIELTWHRDVDGCEYPVAWHPVHMSRFQFDRLGNMALFTRENVAWGAYVSGDPQKFDKIMPDGKFMYHIHRFGQGMWNQPANEGYIYYGTGEDIPLYYVVTWDIFCLRFKMKFLETFGIPPKILYYPENRSLTADIVRIADSLRCESVITIPRLMSGSAGVSDPNNLYKVDQLTPSASSIDWFTDHSERYTRPRVSAILLGSSDEGMKQDGKGGYSDHASRKDAGPNIFFKRDALNISGTINKQMIPAICLGRWPQLPPSYWPLFSMEASEERDRMQEAQIYGAASEKVPVPVADFYDAVGIRKPDPGEEVMGGPVATPPPMQPGQDHPGHIPGRNPNMASPQGAAALGGNILGTKPMDRPFPRNTGMPRNNIGGGLNGGQHGV